MYTSIEYDIFMINWNWSGIGALDAHIEEIENEEEPTKTCRSQIREDAWPPGNFEIIVTDDYFPLFTTATWSVVLRVNGKIVDSTPAVENTHSAEFIKRWAKQMIRTRKAFFVGIGVDVNKEYAKFGGNPNELTL